MSAQQTLELLEEPATDRPRTFALGAPLRPERQVREYAKDLAATARKHGEAAARRNDPDLFDQAVQIIESLADVESRFTPAAVRRRLGGVAPPGSAFSYCRRRGLIVQVDTEESTDPSRRGSLVRVWLGSRWT